jgi:hypothetical protein
MRVLLHAKHSQLLLLCRTSKRSVAPSASAAWVCRTCRSQRSQQHPAGHPEPAAPLRCPLHRGREGSLQQGKRSSSNSSSSDNRESAGRCKNLGAFLGIIIEFRTDAVACVPVFALADSSISKHSVACTLYLHRTALQLLPPACCQEQPTLPSCSPPPTLLQLLLTFSWHSSNCYLSSDHPALTVIWPVTHLTASRRRR